MSAHGTLARPPARRPHRALIAGLPPLVLTAVGLSLAGVSTATGALAFGSPVAWRVGVGTLAAGLAVAILAVARSGHRTRRYRRGRAR